MCKAVNIGLFGFGVVGQGLYDILNKSTGINARIAKIAVKQKDKERSLPKEYFTFDAEEILNNNDIDLIVELINDADDAYLIIKTALLKGKNVVSANKKVLAEHFEEFIQLQLQTGKSILYEASVCGGIPIIRTIEEYYISELLYSIKGIFNGSSNYILSKMQEENLDYKLALSQAQELGFAESDPKLDVEGFDAKYKLVILAAHSFGVYIHPDKVFNYGISGISKFDIQFAKEKNLKIKLIASAYKNSENTICLYVIPAFVDKYSNLYLVENEYNGVTVEGAFSDNQFFSGKGAGGHPTGSAVLSDIAANSYQYKYEYHKTQKELQYSYNNDTSINIYVRHEGEIFESNYFESVFERFQNNEAQYLIGRITIKRLEILCIEQLENIQFICQTM
jgi:homoserine dehydrogenase